MTTLTFILEMQTAPDTRFLCDDAKLVAALERALCSVAWCFTNGTAPAVKVVPLPPETLVIVRAHDA